MDTEDPLRLWQHVHGAFTHFPIALAFVSVAFDIGSVLFKKVSWRTVGFWMLVAAGILIVPAILSGLYGIYLDPSGKANFAAGGYELKRTMSHRNAGLIGGGVLLVPMLWRVIKRDELSKTAYIICILIAIIAAGFIGYTGYQGAYVPRGV